MSALNFQMAIKNAPADLSKAFKMVMDLETKRYTWVKLDEAQLVSSIALVTCIEILTSSGNSFK